MNSNQVHTKRGQAGLLAVAFSTPFLVVVGSGGYAQASYQESTGNINFVIREKSPTAAETVLMNHAKMIQIMKDKYGLGVDQISKLIGVSRPTIYSWLKSENGRVQESHTKYVESLFNVLEQRIDDENKAYLGRLLRRKLDPRLASIFRQKGQETVSDDSFQKINFKLSGLKRSEVLREKLSSRKAMI